MAEKGLALDRAGAPQSAMAICASCGEASPERARFCLACGAPLGPVPSREERKVVSVLFVDLVGSTAAGDGADPEDVRQMLVPYHGRVKKEVERFGGRVEKFVGDGVMAVFGAPVAHEDDAERAVRAALGVVAACAELNVRLRTAVASGEALVAMGARAEVGDAFVAGDVVNTASRLQTVAPEGGVVVDEMTFGSTRSAIDFEELPPVEVKGKRAPVHLWRARAARSRFGADPEPRSPVPFVGRAAELKLLHDAFDRSVREGATQLVTIAGEPGVGKTRLVYEFRQQLGPGRDDIAWRRGRCLPYGDGITYWALGEIVKAQSGVVENDPPDVAADKLSAVVRAVTDDEDRPWVESKLAFLLGIGHGGGGERADAFAAWSCFLEGIAGAGPLVLVVEDLHWADPALVDFLEYLLDFSGRSPILLLATSRPELYERHPSWGGGKRNSTTVALSPLTGSETAELVSRLLPSAVLSADLEERLVEQAGGNPLYAEEFARVLIERGVERAEAVPHGVHALVAARIDLLAPEAKGVLHDAAVVGKVFWPGAVAAIGGRDRHTVEVLVRELVRKEFVRPASRRSSISGDTEYSFWHATVRDVAYGQIPRAARAQKHQAVAAWIEGIAPGREVDHAELLAHHYEEALRLARSAGMAELAASVVAPAGKYLELAGDRAAPLGPRQADAFYLRALELLPVGDRARAAVLVKRMDTFGWVPDVPWKDTEEVFHEAVTLYRSSGDSLGLGAAYVSYVPTVHFAGDRARAADLAEEGLRLLETGPPGPQLARAYIEVARYRSGAEELAMTEKAVALADSDHLRCEALDHRGRARLGAGDFGGRQDMLDALDLARRAGLSRQTLACLNDLSAFDIAVVGPEPSLAWSEEALSLAGRRAMEGLQNWARCATLPALYELGRWDDAVARVAEVRDWEGKNMRYLAGTAALAYIVRILVWRGALAEASAYGDELFERARANRDSRHLGAAALLAEARGQPAAALDLVREVADMGVGNGRVSTIQEIVRIAIRCGDLDLAARLRAQERGSYPRTQHVLVSADAALAEAGAEREQALALYLDAAERWQRWGFVLEHALALEGAARCGAPEGLEGPGGEGEKLLRSLQVAHTSGL